MPSEIRSRLVVLAALAVLGVALAGIGTVFGMTGPIVDAGADAEFVVSEERVAFATAGENVTVVENMSNVREVAIAESEAGQFTVRTEEEQPLTDAERERAEEIVRDNRTVRRHLDAMAEYELAVEPVQRLNVSQGQLAEYNVTLEVNGTGDADETDGTFTVVTENTSRDNRGTVVVQREPSYVEDRAVVRVRQPDESAPRDLKYTVDVDLANGTVTDVIDWDELRADSPTVNGTEINSSRYSGTAPD